MQNFSSKFEFCHLYIDYEMVALTPPPLRYLILAVAYSPLKLASFNWYTGVYILHCIRFIFFPVANYFSSGKRGWEFSELYIFRLFSPSYIFLFFFPPPPPLAGDPVINIGILMCALSVKFYPGD